MRSIFGASLRALLPVIAMGLGAVPAFAQDLPLIRDAEIETLLSDYAQPIFKAAGLGGNRVSMRIIRNDAFNAFVLDGGHVYIHTGALVAAKTPNEVIGIIAHETGHIAGAHVAQMQSRVAREQTRTILLKVLGIGAAILTGRPEAIMAPDEIQVRSFLAMRRTQESSADQAGLTFLSATHQSGKGMLDTFERFAQQDLLSPENQDPYVRTHPVGSDRMAQLRERVAQSPYTSVKDPPALQLRHDFMRAKLYGFLEPPQSVLNRYPVSDTSMPARYARAIGKFFRGGQGALEGALVEIDGLIRERADNPYFHELKGELLQRAGQAANAIGPYRQALKLSGGNTLIESELAAVLVASNNPAVMGEAETLLRKSLVNDPNPSAYRSLADALYKSNKTADADAAIAQAHYFEGNLKQAQIFAKRAQKGLVQGSPAWVKMDDIITAKISE